MQTQPEVIALLIEEYGAQRQAIGRAMDAHDLEAVRPLAHRLKGAMAVFHNGEPYEAADRLERGAAAGDAEEAARAWAALSAHLERLLIDLRSR